MLSGLLSAELSATCNALGYSSGITYYTDPYVKETITDLIRYLRRDDEDHTIRRHLGCAKVLQTDLIPIIIHHSENVELFDVLLRLLVNLTNPALLIYQEELPSDRTSRHYFLQIISQLQSYKEAFTQQRVWEILAKKLGDLLQIEYQERDEDESRTMERILILARNVLQVPADPDLEKRPDNDASVHDQVLWSLHQAGMVDLFLYIATTDHEQQYYMHILEIVSLMLREQNPTTLASAALQRSVEEKELDEKELLQIRQREIIEKQSKIKKYAGSRHSRFGGTFVVKNVKSISDNELIFHKPLSKAITFSFDLEKQKSRVPKNKVSLSHRSSERRSAFSVRLFLKEFCVEFLNGAYNPLMYRVRENLVRAVGQPNDETYYFWAMKFFMEFNRLYKFQVKLISETMHQQIFHFVQTQMENWLEHMITDKKKIPVWSRRIHTALKAYQELLMTLQAMDKSPEGSVRDSARVIKSNIFYQSEYRELVIYLFNVYTETKFSKDFLKDLVETTHIFLKMLDHFCSRHQNLVVQGKARKKKKKKKKTAPKKSGATTANLEAIWDQVGPELSAVLQGHAEIPSVIPFDAISELSMDQQKVEAMKKIQVLLKQGNFEESVGLLRSSREVWPENDCFGHANMAADEEFLAMREIFMTDIGQLEEVSAQDVEYENEEDEDNEEDPRDVVVPEQSFKFIEFAARIACPRVLSAVCLLLDEFETNSSFTNHCIVKLLHRVAWDCKMPALLFQATLFRVFQRVFKSTNSEHKELAKFAIFIIRKFAEMSKTNKKIYMEILFWKSKKEAEELEVGYGNADTKSHSSKNVWREEQEDELCRLAAEYERDTPEPDAVGWIMKNMIDQSRSRRAVIKKMKELYLVVGNMKTKSKQPKEFTEEEEAELKALYEQYKDASDPMNCIIGRLAVPRGRQTLVNKLVEMGLVTDKKQLRKKSSNKDKKSEGGVWGKQSDDESIYDSWSDEDSENAPRSSTKKNKAKTQRFGQPSVAQMICNLQKVVEADLIEPLEWLKSSLKEVLEDLDDADETDEGTALLPLTADCIQAMEHPTFLQLLDILSIDKPTDQEMYWRVPGRWKVEDLNKRIHLIQDALDGKLPEIDPDAIEEVPQYPGIPTKSSPDNKRKSLKKKTKKSLTKLVRSNEENCDASSHSSSSSEDDGGRSPSLIKKKVDNQSSSEDSDSQSRRQNSNSDDEDSRSNKDNKGINSLKALGQTSVSKQIKSKRTKSDSDSDAEISKSTKINYNKNNQFNDSSDSDSENQKTSLSKRSSVTSSKENKSTTDKTVSKRKRVSIEPDLEDENMAINSIITTKSSQNYESSSIVLNSKDKTNSIKRKKLSIDSDSDDDKNTTVNTLKRSITSPTQRSRRFKRISKKNNLTSDSDSDHDIKHSSEISNVNCNRRSSDSESDKSSQSTKASEVSLSHRRGRNSSSKPTKIKRKKPSIDSDSDDEKNTTLNSTKTTIASPKNTSKMEKSVINETNLTSDSDSDHQIKSSTQKSNYNSNRSSSDSESDKTSQSTKASEISLSHKSNQNSSSKPTKIKNKKPSIDSDSNDEKNTTLNSTNTTIASPKHTSKMGKSVINETNLTSDLDSDHQIKSSTQKSNYNSNRSSSDSESDKTSQSTKVSEISLSHKSSQNSSSKPTKIKKNKPNTDSDTDDEKNTTLNSTNTTIASLKHNSKLGKSVSNETNLTSDSDSDHQIKLSTQKSNYRSSSDSESNKTSQSTKASEVSLRQKMKLNSSSTMAKIKRKKPNTDSESDNEKNTSLNSTNTTIASLMQKSERGYSVSKDRNLTSDSDYDHKLIFSSQKNNVESERGDSPSKTQSCDSSDSDSGNKTSQLSRPSHQRDLSRSKRISNGELPENKDSFLKDVSNHEDENNSILKPLSTSSQTEKQSTDSIKSNITPGPLLQVDSSTTNNSKRKRFSIESESDDDEALDGTIAEPTKDNSDIISDNIHLKRKRLVIDSDSDS